MGDRKLAETLQSAYTSGMKKALSNEARKVRLSPPMLASMYANGETLTEIARHFGVSVQPVKRILRESGVRMRKPAKRPGVGIGSDNPAWKGGRRVRKDDYVMVWTPGGDRLEHRVIMEKAIGRPLLDAEIVHHKDGNRSNNVLENLELFGSQSEHALHHGEANRKTLLSKGLKQCTLCLLVKPLRAFYRTRSNRMGVQSWCKKCKNKRDSERRKRRRDQ